jgi:hypothetical protein
VDHGLLVAREHVRQPCLLEGTGLDLLLQ